MCDCTIRVDWQHTHYPRWLPLVTCKRQPYEVDPLESTKPKQRNKKAPTINGRGFLTWRTGMELSTILRQQENQSFLWFHGRSAPWFKLTGTPSMSKSSRQNTLTPNTSGALRRLWNVYIPQDLQKKCRATRV